MIKHLCPELRQPRRVVLLGGSGVIGRFVEDELASKGIATVSLSSKDVDLLDDASPPRLAGILKAEDTLVLLAALTPDKGKDSETMMRNLKMTIHIEKALALQGAAHLVTIGSDAVYDDSLGLIHETSLRFSRSLYGIMHIARETILDTAARSAGIPHLIVRPVAVYGPQDPHHSYGPNRFIRQAQVEKRITLWGEGEEKRDHLFVRDLARLIAEAIQHKTTGEMNAATGKSLSFMEIAKLLQKTYEELRGSPVAIERKPRPGPVTHRHYDITTLTRAFPAFRFTDPKEAIRLILGHNT